MQSQTVELSQERENAVRSLRAGRFLIHYGYARATESRAANEPGQDYLSLRFDDRRLVFALCDGVSLSFYGNLAARILGNSMVEWLWSQAKPLSGREKTAQALREFLGELTKEADKQIEAYSLPADLPPLVAEVLDHKRAWGSETTLVCGRLDLPDEVSPGVIMLAWLGDSRLRLWSAQGERTAELGDAFKTEQRWSTKRGIIGGEPNLFLEGLSRFGSIRRVLAYSDGLALLDSIQDALDATYLQGLIDQAGEAANSDDISVLEVMWQD